MTRAKRVGRASYAIRLPDSLREWRLTGGLNTPSHEPDCEIPADNSGVATIDPATGAHALGRAKASGACVDTTVIDALARLVCDTWSSDPPRYSDGSHVRLAPDESITLTVDFPIRAAAG